MLQSCNRSAAGASSGSPEARPNDPAAAGQMTDDKFSRAILSFVIRTSLRRVIASACTGSLLIRTSPIAHHEEILSPPNSNVCGRLGCRAASDFDSGGVFVWGGVVGAHFAAPLWGGGDVFISHPSRSLCA